MTGPTALTPAPTTTVTAQAPMSLGPHSSPQFDVIEFLPSGAADKLRALRQRSDDLHAIIPAFENIREANTARVEAETALKRLTNHPQDFGFDLKPDDPRVIAAQRHLDKMTADAKRLTELQQVRSAAWQSASQAKTACETWLRDGRPHGTVLEDHEGEPPKLAKNEPGLLDAIENRRRKVREMKALIHAIQSSCFPSSYSKQRAREQVDVLAQRGAVSVSRLVELDGEIEFPSLRVQSAIYNAEPGAVAFHESVDVVALMAFLHKPTLLAAIDRLIDDEADDAGSLSHEERQRREAEAQGDLLAIERDECALVWLAQSQNLPCEHRPDVSVAALLSITLATTPLVNETPGTTPGLSWPWRR